MAESQMRQAVCRAIKCLDPVPVENSVGRSGTPDINFAEGWIELKEIDRWPSRDSTPLRVRPFTDAQRHWHRVRARHNGNTFVLVRVQRKDWILFDGKSAAEHLGNLTKEQMRRHALRFWEGRLVVRELLNALQAECRT